MAQPPLLENGGEWTRLATNPVPLFKGLRRRLHPILQMALQFIQFLIEFVLAGNHQPHKDEDDGEGQSVGGKREL